MLIEAHPKLRYIFDKHQFTDYEVVKQDEDTYILKTHVFDRRLFNEVEGYLKQFELTLIWEKVR